MALPSFLTGNLWKIATGIVGVISLGLIAALIATNFETQSLMKQRDALSAQINDPVTGYVAQLSQARTNVAQLTKAIEVEKASFQKLEKESNVRLQQTEKELAAAQVRTRDMQRRLNSFMATGPKGDTPLDRIRDIDTRGLSEMVQ